MAAGRLPAAFLIAAGITGCAGAAPAAPAPPAPDLDRLRALPPITGLVHTWSPASDRVTRAQQKLTVDCMAARGFGYRPAPPATAAEMAARRPAPFGLETLAPPPPERPLPPERPDLGERYGRALHGDPDRRLIASGARTKVTLPVDGCIAAAESRVLGADRVRWTRLRILIGEAEEDALTRLEKDPEFRAATTRWRECARRSGVQAPDPPAVAAGLADTDPAAQPAARIDLGCKAGTGYLATAYGRLAAIQHERLARSPTVVPQWTALLAKQDAVARGVLGS